MKKKFSKTATAVALSAMLLFNTGAPASAAQSTVPDMVSAAAAEPANVLTDMEQIIYFYLRDNYRLIPLEKYQLTEAEVSQMVFNIFDYDPALSLAMSKRAGNEAPVSYITDMENQYVVWIAVCKGPNNDCTDEEFNAMYEESQKIADSQEETALIYQNSLKAAQACINEKMTDAEKVLAIHDYLISTIIYDYDNYLANTIPVSSYQAFGALALKTAVCSGYAAAMETLLQKAGIECKRVSSAKMNHAWNVVKLDGEWYHLDATWDDPVTCGAYDVFSGLEYRNYFLMNEKEIQKLDHYGFDSPYPSTSTKYSDMFRPPLASNYKKAGHYWFDGSALYDFYGRKVESIRTNGYAIDQHRGLLIYQSRQQIHMRDCWSNKDSIIYTLSTEERGNHFPNEAFVSKITGYNADSQVVSYEYTNYDAAHSPVTLKGSCPLNISIPAVSIVFENDKITLPLGASKMAAVSLFPSDTTDSKEIQWISSQPSVASVDKDGKITGLDTGTCTITAKAGNISAQCQVTVTQEITSIQLSQTEITLKEGETFSIRATTAPQNATDVVKWMSTNDNLVKVDDNGNVTALEEGGSIIVAMSGKQYSMCSVYVEGVIPLTSLSVSPTSLSMKQGDTQALTLSHTPSNSTAWQHAQWTTSDGGTAEVSQTGIVTAYNPGTATITAKAGSLSASCTVTVTGSDTMHFEDVNPGDWFYDTVRYVYERKLMTGLSDTIFAPADELSRAQFATILYRMENSPAVTYQPKFQDVPDNQFYTEPVLWANSEQVKVVTGYANGCFGPADPITREQMALMMYRYAGYKGYDRSVSNDLMHFPDKEKVSDFSETAVKWAVGAGLITGDNGRINPQGKASRAVCATIIMRFLNNYK